MQRCVQGPSQAHHVSLSIKLYWNTATPLHSCIVYDCACTAAGEWSHCNRLFWLTELQTFTICPVILKNLEDIMNLEEKEHETRKSQPYSNYQDLILARNFIAVYL